MAKYGLCVGLNYVGTGSDLAGCLNDADDWAALLDGRGFAVEQLKEQAATRDNILGSLERLVGTLTSGDLLVFTFSGHGSWVPDESGDEDDERDEVLVPYDIESGVWITDDELAVAMEHKHGARVAMISDSCHSGTVSKMSTKLTPSERPRRIRFMPPSVFMGTNDVRGFGAQRSAGLAMKAVRSQGVLLLGGCRDFEYSYDAWFGDRANGAFTRAAIDSLAEVGEKKPTKGGDYRAWHKAIRTRLPSAEYPQTPTLYAPGYQKKWEALGEGR